VPIAENRPARTIRFAPVLTDSSRKRFVFGVPSVRSIAQNLLRGFVFGRSALARNASAEV